MVTTRAKAKATATATHSPSHHDSIESLPQPLILIESIEFPSTPSRRNSSNTQDIILSGSSENNSLQNVKLPIKRIIVISDSDSEESKTQAKKRSIISNSEENQLEKSAQQYREWGGETPTSPYHRISERPRLRHSTNRTDFNKNLKKLLDKRHRVQFSNQEKNKDEQELVQIDLDIDQERDSRQQLSSSNSDSSSSFEEEEIDLDKSAIIEKRTRGQRESRYRDSLRKLLARKRDKTKDISINLDKDDNDDNDDDGEEEEAEEEELTQTEDPNDDLRDFIVEAGEDEDISNIELPEEFASTQNLEYHFKVFIQYLIYLVMVANYSDIEKHQYFRSSMKIIDRKIDGYRDSLVASSVWTLEFKRCLNFYPKYTSYYSPHAFCDACNSSKPAYFKVSLSGQPYNRKTLQSRNKSDSDSSADGIEEIDVFHERKRDFYLGRFCSGSSRAIVI
ncbi:hypothetical protein G9A89_002081 [Geosiphon pyriformis]|nr:hypothetical protein G9A89_002081 [Geosiphon pyriformis]